MNQSLSQALFPADHANVELDGISYPEMTKLAMLAYAGFYLPNTHLNAWRVKQLVEKYAPDQEIVWGPVASKPLFGVFTNSLIYIVKDKTKAEPSYTIVSRGTNLFSMSSFLIQDMWINSMATWSTVSRYAKIETGRPVAISLGANRTMDIIRDLKYKGKTLKEFATEVLAEENSKLQFTGHSLGGVSSQLISTWFLEDFQEEGIDVDGRFTLVSIAAPSPGNADFVAHLERVFDSTNNRFVRLVNTRDVSNIYWNSDLVASYAATVYAEADIYPNSQQQDMVNFIFNHSNHEDYRHLPREYVFEYPINPEITDWTAQGLYQHLFSYAGYFLKDQEQELIKELSVDMAPHFMTSRDTKMKDKFKALRAVQREQGTSFDFASLKSAVSPA